MKKMYFISGLPRSGSTLLAAVLKQNPLFYASMSSALAPLVEQTIQTLGSRSEYASLIDNTKRKNVVTGLFRSFYEDQPKNKVIFDTNRAWCSKMPLLAEIFNDFRVIACVRHPCEIANSFEKLFRKSPLLATKMMTKETAAGMYTRVEYLLSRTGVIGFALNALQEAMYGEQNDRLIILNYDSFVENPDKTIRKLYQILGEEPFLHDYANVTFSDAEDFDDRIGIPGLHSIKKMVHPIKENRNVLSPEILRRFPSKVIWEESVRKEKEIDIIW